jgi:hypothetical protein
MLFGRHIIKKMEGMNMKSLSTMRLILGPAICVIAFSASNGAALAQSLEVQCRSAVRVLI